MDPVLALARRLALPTEDAVVLSNGANLIVDLRPVPVVARATRIHHLYRPVEAFAPVITAARSVASLLPPTDLVDPGPYVLPDGRYVTFWKHVDATPAEPAEGGRALRELHEAGRAYRGPLRSFDPRPDALRIAALVDPDVAEVLRASAERLPMPELPAQLIHGDAHLSNVLKGGLWIDLDDVCLGPREWDLACLRHRSVLWGEIRDETRRAFAAYGPCDEATVDQFDALVMLSIVAGTSLGPLIGETIGPRGRRRIEWLRQRVL